MYTTRINIVSEDEEHEFDIEQHLKELEKQKEDPYPQDPSAKYTYEQNEEVKDPKLSILSVRQILAWNDDPKDVLLSNGYLTKGDFGVICGPPGIGKSRLMLQLAMCCILGKQFLKWDTYAMGMRWLFLQSENGMRRLRADFVAMTKELNKEEVDLLDKHLFVHGLVLDTDGDLNIVNGDFGMRVKEAISDYVPDIVVGDPLMDFTPDDTIGDGAMKTVAKAYQKVVKMGNPKRVPLVVHHAKTGRAPVGGMASIDRSSYLRGSKVLAGVTRWMWNTAPANEKDNDRMLFASGKCNNAKEFEPFVIELNKETMWYEVDDLSDADAIIEAIASGSGAGRPAKGDRSECVASFNTVTPLSVEAAFKIYENRTAKAKRVSYATFKAWKKECVELEEVVLSNERGKYLKG